MYITLFHLWPHRKRLGQIIFVMQFAGDASLREMLAEGMVCGRLSSESNAIGSLIQGPG